MPSPAIPLSRSRTGCIALCLGQRNSRDPQACAIAGVTPEGCAAPGRGRLRNTRAVHGVASISPEWPTLASRALRGRDLRPHLELQAPIRAASRALSSNSSEVAMSIEQ